MQMIIVLCIATIVPFGVIVFILELNTKQIKQTYQGLGVYNDY